MDADTLGFDAVGLGDVDGDGGTDFLLSAAWSEVHGARTGRVWIVAGPAPEKGPGTGATKEPAKQPPGGK